MDAVAQSSNQPQHTAAQPVIQSTSLGAVQLTLSTDRQTMGIADRLRLTLSVEAPAEMAVSFPPIDDKLGPFTVWNQNATKPQTTAPKTQQWKQEYILEVESVGEQTIPALTISFQPAEAAQDAVPQQLSTEPLTITVTTVLPNDADVNAPLDIGPPVALAWRGLPAWVWAVVAAVLVGLGLLAGVWWYRRRRTRIEVPPPPRPAHVLALEALQRLQQQDLITQKRIEEFYVQLSDILRRYVEWRFGLRAPEQTTEEFLAVALATGGLIATHRELLSDFLQHCDLVKFARYQPSPDDMQQAWESARVFVEQTADTEVMVEVEAAGVEAL